MECFVMMPFASHFDDVYEVIKTSVENTIQDEIIKCYRLDENLHAGQITDELLSAIRSATFCIADSTESNPNVMWEIGFAMALKKPVIFIHQKGSETPFDIQNIRAIKYDRNALMKTLQGPLHSAAAATIAHYDLPTTNVSVTTEPELVRTYSITGSMNADPVVVQSRLSLALAPFLRNGVTWLCGSNGVVDEAAIDYLAKMGEKIEAFGYHKFDISDTAKVLMTKHNIPFFDPAAFPIPAGIEGPSTRDRLFLSKASFHFLLWNGRSSGIAKLKKIYDKQKVSYQIIFT